MLIDDYLEYQIKYELIYGENTIVLMQVGSFFEFYGVNNETEKIGDPQKITELLNIQLTRRNKAILENSRSNCLMAGFPTHALKRFINILLLNNYTVVLIEQITEPPNPERAITQIYSPGTYIEEINHCDGNNIVSLYITEEQCYKKSKSLFIFGLSSIDLSTGISNVYENSVLFYEKYAFLEEIYRFIESNNPKEVIIHHCNLKNISINDIRYKLNNQYRLFHYHDKINNKFFNINYQNQFLQKIFLNTGHMTPIEYINMEKRNYALISFLLLLQFSYEHNERIINKIQIPTNWIYDEHMILYNNAIYQLNIIPSYALENGSSSRSKIRSVFDIIQKTSTNMGKRLLKYRIMNPIINIDTLNKRYELVSTFIKADLIKPVENILNEIIDIERLHRKMGLQILHPYEFLNLSYSYENIKKLFMLLFIDQQNLDISIFKEHNMNMNIIDQFDIYIKDYTKIFDLHEMGKYGLLTIDNSFFNKGIYSELDNIQYDINNIHIKFNEESKMLSELIEQGSDFVKIENNDKDGYFYYTTKKRCDILISKFNSEQKSKYEIKKYNGANVKIVSHDLIQNSNKLIELKNKIGLLTKNEYLKTLCVLEEKYMDMLNNITKFIALIDVIKCSALCAKIYNYERPIIKDLNNGSSFFEAYEIRHPIIEIINENVEYVGNNIKLKNDETNGILLYGVNGSGKSSLSKAVGCNILLAQIGFYVPSKEFVFYPYKKIFTRINGDDNIFKGMSSFAVEMDELRSILKYSDCRSIVLGDEICKGTEETSALAIVSASILRFCENNVNFIFATHFHKLYEMDVIKGIENIAFKHLSIECDKENDIIIYGRKLLDGPGDNLYGIEIASFLIKDDDFIKNAKNIRNCLLNKKHNQNDILINKTSNYNNKLYVDCCSICGINGNTYPLDTHHIKEQHIFNEYDANKDKLCNIVILCKTHHDEVHNGKLQINGYIDTIDGPKLSYEYISEKKTVKKKYNEHDIKTVKEYGEKLKGLHDFMKVMKIELKKVGLNMGNIIIQKILDGNY
jgi:DNA mismatch repair protein MutS